MQANSSTAMFVTALASLFCLSCYALVLRKLALNSRAAKISLRWAPGSCNKMIRNCVRSSVKNTQKTFSRVAFGLLGLSSCSGLRPF